MYDPKLNWRTISTDHFNVHFPHDLEQQAIKASGYLEEAYTKLTPKFNWKPWGRTEILVTDSNDSANGTTTTVPYNWIVLRLASPNPDSVLAGYDNWLRELIFHEYAHVLHLDQYGGIMTIPRIFFGKIIAPNGTTPGFIREGISTYIETSESSGGRGRSSYAEMMLRTAILNNSFLKIDEADGLMWRWPSYQGMYIYGVKFMQYLVDRFGEDRLMKFHNEMSKSPYLYAVNHQARHVFKDIEYQSKKVHNHYDKVRKDGTPRSETFYDLWKDWKKELEVKYAKQKEELSAKGLTEFEKIAGGETVLSHPAASSDGKHFAYSRQRVTAPSEIHLVDQETGKDKIISKKRIATGITFSPDGKKLIYSSLGGYKTYNYISDLYLYDIEKKKTKRLTTGQRASDPSFAPDGNSVIFVKQDGGSSWLATLDIEKNEIKDLNKPESLTDFYQFATPVYSPDGKWLAFSSWQLKGDDTGAWDLFVAPTDDLKKTIKISDDFALDAHPVWGADNKTLYFASDKTGVNNIFKVTIKKQKGALPVSQVTNVLTGVYQPFVSQDEKTLYVQYYNGDGFDIRKTSLGGKEIKQDYVSKISLLPKDKTLQIKEKENVEPKENDIQSKKYSPFGKSLFLPRFVIPNLATLDNGVMVGAFTGGTDPLRRHTWIGGATYRTDLSDYVGYYFNYAYSRYRPTFSLGSMGYAVKYGSYTFCQKDANGQCIPGTIYSKNLFEKRLRGSTTMTIPFGKSAFGLGYFFENWGSNFTSAELAGLAANGFGISLGRYAGASVSYVYGNAERYLSSISNEHGMILRSNFTITDRWLGANKGNEQRIFAGDLREYLNLPWANHILALRVGGGMVWGDQMNQGTFTLGGALGEGTMGGGSSLYYFPLRGINVASLSDTRAMLLSGEYRFPIISPQRGFGTTPFYIQAFHFAPFVDFGNAWGPNTKMGSYFFNNFLLSTGAELRGDFIIGHGLPFTGRIGYGIVVKNRNRLTGPLGPIKDPLIGNDLTKGTLILQLGTAF